MPNNGKFQHQQVTVFEKLFIGFFIELRLCNLSYQSKIGILASKRKNPAISAGHFAYVNVGARNTLARSKPHVGNVESTVYYLINIVLIVKEHE
jgi:hypothetical protein